MVPLAANGPVERALVKVTEGVCFSPLFVHEQEKGFVGTPEFRVWKLRLPQ